MPTDELSSFGGHAMAGLGVRLLPTADMQNLTSSPFLAGSKMHFVCICVAYLLDKGV